MLAHPVGARSAGPGHLHDGLPVTSPRPDRAVGSDAERARTTVTRSIRYAIDRVEQHHPPLAAHLHHAVNTGTYCSYTPDPLASVVWEA